METTAGETNEGKNDNKLLSETSSFLLFFRFCVCIWQDIVNPVEVRRWRTEAFCVPGITRTFVFFNHCAILFEEGY